MAVRRAVEGACAATPPRPRRVAHRRIHEEVDDDVIADVHRGQLVEQRDAKVREGGVALERRHHLHDLAQREVGGHREARDRARHHDRHHLVARHVVGGELVDPVRQPERQPRHQPARLLQPALALAERRRHLLGVRGVLELEGHVRLEEHHRVHEAERDEEEHRRHHDRQDRPFGHWRR